MSIRPVAVSSGAEELRYVQLTEKNGEDISASPVSGCLALDGEVPDVSEFVTADDIQRPTTSVVRIGVMVKLANTEPGKWYRVWGGIDDGTETIRTAAPHAFKAI